jgi:hypothetical protein
MSERGDDNGFPGKMPETLCNELLCVSPADQIWFPCVFDFNSEFGFSGRMPETH